MENASAFPSLLPFKWRKNNTFSHIYPRASLVAQLVKNPPAVQATWVRFLGWEDALKKGMATHSRILAWRILYMDYTVHGVAKSWTRLSDFHFHFPHPPKVKWRRLSHVPIASRTKDLICHSPAWWWYGIADLLLCVYINQERTELKTCGRCKNGGICILTSCHIKNATREAFLK